MENRPVERAPASYARRAVAVLIDGGLTLGAAIAVYASGLEPQMSFLSRGDGFLIFIPVNWALIGATYSTVLHGRGRGQTLGKMIVGIGVIDAKTGGAIGLGRAFKRWFATAFLWGFFPLSAGFPVLLIGGVLDSAWPLFDAQRRALHDKVVGSVVCKTVPARLPSWSIRFGDDAMGRPLSVRLVTAAAAVGLIFVLAAGALNPVLRIVLFLGVALACVDAVSGRSLRTPSPGNRLPLLARIRSEFAADVVGEIGRTDRIGATDFRTRILSAAADGRLALFALLAGILALYGQSSLLTTERVESYRLVVALFGLALLAPLPGSMHVVALQLRARASSAAAVACFGSVLVLALGAHFVSPSVFVLGLALAAAAARLTRDALQTRAASPSSADTSAVHV